MFYAIIIYLWILTFCLIGYYASKKHLVKLMWFFVYQCEKINFAFLLALHDEKDYIIKYNDVVDILFAKKKYFMTLKWYNLDRFMNCYFGLNSDMKYFEQLVQKKKFDYAIFASLQEVSWIMKWLLKAFNLFYLYICYLTLWLFFLIEKKKYS